ncbi:MAG TPA: tetratricopeptide repeat protein [Vicinamibacteria bacterium]|nr:tetratricopeptide repeat protein [Vicinamibacteria bacterium]
MAVDFRLRLGARADDLTPKTARDHGAPESVDVDPDPREVLRAFGRAATREPGEPDYDFLLGCALLRAGEPARAAAHCADAVRLDRSNPEYHFALGCALWQLGRVEEAERAFREAAELRPGDAEARNAWGAALVRLGRPADGVAELQTALKAEPRLAEAQGNVGVALWWLGRRAEAVRALRRAVRLAPDEPEPLRNLGLALLELGRPDRAAEVLRRAAALSPGQAPALLDLAQAAFEAGRHEEAQGALDRASGIDATAIVSRPRTLAARDALRLERLRAESAELPRRTPDLHGVALRALLSGAESLGGLWPRGRVATPLFLGAALVAVVAASQLLAPMVDHYLLRDAVTIVARAPVDDDVNVRDRLAHAIGERGKETVVDAQRCAIQTRPSWRRITCEYAVPRKILPGWSRTLRFRIDVEQPYVAPAEGRR